jgi:hypothetical protein
VRGLRTRGRWSPLTPVLPRAARSASSQAYGCALAAGWHVDRPDDDVADDKAAVSQRRGRTVKTVVRDGGRRQRLRNELEVKAQGAEMSGGSDAPGAGERGEAKRGVANVAREHVTAVRDIAQRRRHGRRHGCWQPRNVRCEALVRAPRRAVGDGAIVHCEVRAQPREFASVGLRCRSQSRSSR